MAEQPEDEVAYYYDFHPTEDDERGEPIEHSRLVHYLVDVLDQLFRGQRCVVHKNLNFYHTSDPNEYPMDPDIAVIKGADRHLSLRSWKIGKTGPAPQVIFEIGQEETWKRDLEEGPMRCARMGVEEYYVYDPQDLPLGGEAGRRLFGWQLDKERGEMREMALRPDGALWSPHLESLLVSDGEYMRLYDTHWQLRLTQAEAEAQRAEEEARRAAMEAEARRAETRRAEAEARRAVMEAEARRAAERQAKAQIRRAEMLAEKLRSLGIDLDQL